MTLSIRRLGHLGEGVADGPVFVPLSLPGEVVEGEVVDGRIARPRIVTPSAQRVRPPCTHFTTCGGCALQHASDDFVAGWKVDVVRRALEAQGLAAPMRPIQTSPARSRRRATFAGRRTKKGVLVGFHARASDILVAIPECQLLHPGLMATIPALERLVALGASRKGEVSLAVTLSDAGPDVSVSGVKEADRALVSELASVAEEFDLARLSWNAELVATRRPPRLRFGVADVVPPAGAFLQATAEAQVALTGAVKEAVGDAAHIADLFAGCGTFTLPLAQRAEVHAVEGEAGMLRALDQGWRQARGLKRVTTEARDLFRRPMLPDELARFDAVVIDPPRAGAEAQMALVAVSDVTRIAAVSCNPVTFARDARILCAAGFGIDWIQVVDQFRWSPHIEVVARLSRDALLVPKRAR